MALLAEDPASCACSNVPITWLLKLPDALPVRLLTAELTAPEMGDVRLENEDWLVLAPAPELEDVDCELPSCDNRERGWLSRPMAKAPTLASDMIAPST